MAQLVPAIYFGVTGKYQGIYIVIVLIVAALLYASIVIFHLTERYKNPPYSKFRIYFYFAWNGAIWLAAISLASFLSTVTWKQDQPDPQVLQPPLQRAVEKCAKKINPSFGEQQSDQDLTSLNPPSNKSVEERSEEEGHRMEELSWADWI
ncbi:MAG: hypothetical protein Q9157_004001 [Trypethelium eluteriae]